MQDRAYSIALVTRGAGAFAYSYGWPAELERGQLVAVPFHNRMEVGVVIAEDSAPPAKQLHFLVPLTVHRWSQLGRLILELCELSMSSPDDLAGHLFFASARSSLRLELAIDAKGLTVGELEKWAQLAGRLKPAAQKALIKWWAEAANLVSRGRLQLFASIAGDPDSTRAPAAWRRDYALSEEDTNLLTLLVQRKGWPGSYLSGFDGVDLKQLQSASLQQNAAVGTTDSSLEFAALEFPAEWQLAQQWPQLKTLRIKRAECSWPELRAADGFLAELQASLAANQRVLVLMPQVWMLERLWPLLSPLAGRIARFRPEAGPSIASHILRMLSTGPSIVVGGPGAWKLAAYFNFDRVIVIDPTHPQYAAERTPHLDPRLALLLCVATGGSTSVDLINFGLDAFDAGMPKVRLQLHEPYAPPVFEGNPTGAHEDVDPLPLELRRPDKRRLVFFNRLGSGRGLYCAECWSTVTCPQCGSTRMHFSVKQSAYNCPDCGLVERNLRCPRCHLMNLVGVLPGLESVTTRPGDLTLRGPQQAISRVSPHASVFGTSQLLEPVASLTPEQIIYIHAEGRVGLLADWPAAVDMAVRLRSLYDNPNLEDVHIVSSRLHEQFGPVASAQQLKKAYATELDLRELTELPPTGTLYHLTLIAAHLPQLNAARQHLGEGLQGLPETQLLRIGRAYRQGGSHRLSAWVVNPQLHLREMQELRWRLHRLGATLTVRALRGPWVW